MNTHTKQKIAEAMKKISDSKILIKIGWGFGILIIAGLIFHAGMIVGFHKASFGRDWNDNFSRNFGPRRPHMMGMMPDDMPNAHGTIGKIISVTLPTFIVEDTDKTEKVVVVSNDTHIKNMRADGAQADLKNDVSVIVIGAPNNAGQIEAKLIRILPEHK